MAKEVFFNNNPYKLVVGGKTFTVGEEFEKAKVSKQALKDMLEAVERGELELKKVKIEATEVKISDKPVKLNNTEVINNDVVVYKPLEVIEPTKAEITLITAHFNTVKKEVNKIKNKNKLERLVSIAKEHGASQAVVNVIEKRLSEV